MSNRDTVLRLYKIQQEIEDSGCFSTLEQEDKEFYCKHIVDPDENAEDEGFLECGYVETIPTELDKVVNLIKKEIDSCINPEELEIVWEHLLERVDFFNQCKLQDLEDEGFSL